MLCTNKLVNTESATAYAYWSIWNSIINEWSLKSLLTKKIVSRKISRQWLNLEKWGGDKWVGSWVLKEG